MLNAYGAGMPSANLIGCMLRVAATFLHKSRQAVKQFFRYSGPARAADGGK